MDRPAGNSTESITGKVIDASRLIADMAEHPALSHSLLQEISEPFGDLAFVPSSSPPHEVPVLSSPSPSPPTSPPPPAAAILASERQSTPLKRSAESFEDLPTPKRVALLSKVKPHPSISTPFKSPLSSQFKTPFKSGSNASSSPKAKAAMTFPSSRSSTPLSTYASRFQAPEYGGTMQSSPGFSSSFETKSKGPSASRPFKSPVIKSKHSSASVASSSSSSLGESLRIAALEKKLQLLKQAARIKAKDSEAQLEGLVIKWKKAARDASEDLWDLLKNNSGDWGFSGDGGGGGSWGFGDDDQSKKQGQMNDNNWGYDELGKDQDLSRCDREEGLDELECLSPPSPSVMDRRLLAALNGPFKLRSTMLHATEERQARWSRGTDFDDDRDGHPVDGPEEMGAEGMDGEDVEDGKEEKEKEWNLGAMLTSMGIPPGALGWNDEEGEFVEA
ncbi:hypothetical protein FRB96_000175 [Tulasnella sp. 330]|nr:hypothetical protein FRB96_000175 [Tulasnella sp. 330]KAG8891079.1 hypothetical protein FRB98_000088 [Tulasnella sp. 332]